MKCFYLITFILASAFVGISGAEADKITAGKPILDTTPVEKALNALANAGKQDSNQPPVVLDLPIYQTPAPERAPIPDNAKIVLTVTPCAPIGDKVPIKNVLAERGLTASYDAERKMVVVKIIPPYCFTDPRPGFGSATWKYDIAVTETIITKEEKTVGAIGVGSKTGTECVNWFGIVSAKDGKQWLPSKNDGYKYIPEIEPKDYAKYGTWDEEALYEKKGAARFMWTSDDPEATITVSWHILGQNNPALPNSTWSDIRTPKQVESNPCVKKKTVVQVATPEPTNPGPANPPSVPPAVPVSPPPDPEPAYKFTLKHSGCSPRTGGRFVWWAFIDSSTPAQLALINKVTYRLGGQSDQPERVIVAAGEYSGKPFLIQDFASEAFTLGATVELKDHQKVALEAKIRVPMDDCGDGKGGVPLPVPTMVAPPPEQKYERFEKYYVNPDGLPGNYSNLNMRVAASAKSSSVMLLDKGMTVYKKGEPVANGSVYWMPVIYLAPDGTSVSGYISMKGLEKAKGAPSRKK